MTQSCPWRELTSSWTPTPELANPRGQHIQVLLSDGRVLVTGGLGAGASAEVYDPELDTWLVAPDMLERRSNHAAVLLADGRVLIAGGQSESLPFEKATAEIYEP